MKSPAAASNVVLEPGRAPRVARLAGQDVDRRLALAVVVDAGLVAGRGRDDRRVQPRRRRRRRGDRDRALHAGMLADGRRAVGWGDPGGHRPMIRRLPSRPCPLPSSRPASALFDGRRRSSACRGSPRRSAAGVEVWIKREDLLPLAFGGNKLRNLEFLVGAALAEGADTLVTSGRRWSNHCRLTAAAGAKAGLAVHLVLSGPPVDPPGPGVRLDERSGRRSTSSPPTTGRSARRPWRAVVAELRGAGGGRTSSASAGPGCRGATARSLAAPRAVRPGARAAGVAVRPRRPGRRRRAGPRPGWSSAGRRGRATATDRRASLVARPAAELRPSIEAQLARPGGARRRAARVDPTADRARRVAARRRLRPPDRRGRGGDALLGADRGDPRRPDLHGQGAGRPHRPGALGRAGRPDGSSSGTPAARPGLFEPLD